MSFSDTDRGFKALLERIFKSKKLVLTVGVHAAEGAAQDGTLTVADVATIHEFGLGHNPERSFIRAWADEQKPENEEALRKIGAAVVNGSFTAEQGLDRAGLLFVAKIQARIRAGIAPPITEKTAERKHSTTPLINTAQLITSIRHKVGPDQ